MVIYSSARKVLMHIKIWFTCRFAFQSDLYVLQIFAYVNFIQKYTVVVMVQDVSGYAK